MFIFQSNAESRVMVLQYLIQTLALIKVSHHADAQIILLHC